MWQLILLCTSRRYRHEMPETKKDLQDYFYQFGEIRTVCVEARLCYMEWGTLVKVRRTQRETANPNIPLAKPLTHFVLDRNAQRSLTLWQRGSQSTVEVKAMTQKFSIFYWCILHRFNTIGMYLEVNRWTLKNHAPVYVLVKCCGSVRELAEFCQNM